MKGRSCRRRLSAPLTLGIATILATATAQAVDIEPLHVELSVEGKPFLAEGCEGGDWSMSWRGELPGESNNISDQLKSYSSFDTTHEQEFSGQPASVTVKPVICRDNNGAIVLQTSWSSGTRAIRGVVALKNDPGIPSPFFDFSVEDAGTCHVKSSVGTQVLENSLIQVRAPLMSALVPELSITREEMERGFSKQYRIEGQALASAMMCMGSELKRGELRISYKSNDKQPTIGLSGCANLPRGGSTNVVAKVDPPGGSVTFSADPASTIDLQPSGTTATATGATPGRATIKGEYTYNGRTATATLPASSVELLSVNGGQPIPKLGLLGVNGKPSSKVYSFPFQANPGDAGDLLVFKAENQASVSVLTQRSSIGIQPVREGRTRVQAMTTCGAPVGEPFEIEIATCDDDVRSELQRRQEELIRREKEIVKRITQLTADPEFQRAATEIKDNTINMAVKTAELIAATLTGSQATAVSKGTASGLSLTQIETAQNIWSVAGIINDGVAGNANSAIVSTYALYLNSWAASALKGAIDSGLAAQQLGQDLGSLAGVVEQLEDLEPRHDAIRRDLYDVTRRVHQCDKLPPPAPLPPRPDGKPPRVPQPQPVPPPVEIPPGTEIPPVPEPAPVPTPQPPVEQPPPPIVDPSPGTGGARLCVRKEDESMTTQEWRTVIEAASSFRTTAQRAREVFENFQASLRDLEASISKDDAARSTAFDAFVPSYNAAVQAYFDMGEASRKQEQRFEPCTAELEKQPPAIERRAGWSQGN